MDANGQKYYVDANGNEYYPSTDGPVEESGWFMDAHGAKYYVDEHGLEYYPDEYLDTEDAKACYIPYVQDESSVSYFAESLNFDTSVLGEWAKVDRFSDLDIVLHSSSLPNMCLSSGSSTSRAETTKASASSRDDSSSSKTRSSREAKSKKSQFQVPKIQQA